MSTSTEGEATRGHSDANASAGTAASTANVSPWILSGWQDLLFFVATPLLIIPLIAILRGYLTVADIALFVISFGAMGHHLPGMLRAYGDRELFRRFRVRFVLAPLFLLAVCSFFAQSNLNGLSVILLFWGAWHGAAQVYGFLRIYDAKAKSFSFLTRKLDMAMCVAWFGLGLFQSPDRMASILSAFYDSGSPLIPASLVHAVQATWLAATAVITIAFLANWMWQAWQGHPASIAKLLVMISCFGFWWYTMIGIRNIILGIAMFEIFHDVQYLAIVWVYNINRVEAGRPVGPFTRFLFRRSWFLIGLYVGLVFAYGYINWFAGDVDTKKIKLALFGFVSASTFLHFYYDGFIWKVREKSTREGLGLSGGQSDSLNQRLVPGWLAHGMKWSLFVLPLVLLATAQSRGVLPEVQRKSAIVRALPKSALAQYQVATPLLAAGQYAEALDHLKRAYAIQPNYPASFDDNGAAAYFNVGQALQGVGHFEEAIEPLQMAVRIGSDFAEARDQLGYVLQVLGRHEEAVEQFREVLRIKPDSAEANMSLGTSLLATGEAEEALLHFEDAVKIKPDYSDAHGNLGIALQSVGRYKEALEEYQKALDSKPDSVNAHNNLARLLATCPDRQMRDGERALVHGKRAVELAGEKNYLLLDTLAATYGEQQDYQQAIHWQERAIELAPAGQRKELQDRLETYRSASSFP